MPGSKARAWKRAKAKETRDKHYGNECHLPDLKRKREESPNTAANRKLLKEEMSKRDMGPKTSKSCSSGKADPRFSFENLMRKRDESYVFESALNAMSCEERKNFTRKDRREDWAKKNATKSPEEIRKDEEEKKKREEEQRQKEEEERVKREEEEERRQKEREEQHRKQEEQKRRYEEHRRKNEERKQMEADRKFMLPSGEDTRKIMELGNDIRKMYLKLSLVYHPDKSEIHKDGIMFKKLKESYDWLTKIYGMA